MERIFSRTDRLLTPLPASLLDFPIQSDLAKKAEIKEVQSDVDGKSNHELQSLTQSLILRGLSLRLTALCNESNPNGTLEPKQRIILKKIADSCSALSLHEISPDDLHKLWKSGEHYHHLRRLKRALIKAEIKGDFHGTIAGHLQLMTETVRILQIQACSDWITMAIEQVQRESQQEVQKLQGRAGDIQSMVISGGLSASIGIQPGKIKATLGIAQRKSRYHNDDTSISFVKNRHVPVGLSLKVDIGNVASAKVAAVGSAHRITTMDYPNGVDAIAAPKIKEIKKHLSDFMRFSSFSRLPGFSRARLVENLQQTARDSVPRLQHLLRVLRLDEALAAEGEQHVINVENAAQVAVAKSSSKEGYRIKGKLKGEAKFEPLFKTQLAVDHARTWLFSSQYQSFLAVQKENASALTAEQLAMHQLRLEKIVEMTSALVPDEKLSLDSYHATSNIAEKLLMAQRELQNEVQQYGALCRELDIAVQLKQKHVQTLLDVKRSMEAQWDISSTGDGRYDYLQRTLLAFCYFHRQWQNLPPAKRPEQVEQREAVQELESKMEKFVTQPPMSINGDQLHNATCFVIEVPANTKSWGGTISAHIGDTRAESHFKGEISFRHTVNTHSSRLRDGHYIDIRLSLGADGVLFSKLGGLIKLALSKAGLRDMALDSAVAEWRRGVVECQFTAGLKGKVMIRFFAPSERFAPKAVSTSTSLKEDTTVPFRLLFIRCLGELEQKFNANVSVPISVAPSVSVGITSSLEQSTSNVLMEYVGANTLCYLATQHHGRASNDPGYLSDWNSFLDTHVGQLGKLFSNLADSQSHASNEARFMLHQQRAKATYDDDPAPDPKTKELEENFFSAMRAYRDCALHGVSPVSKDKLNKAFNLARDQLTALFKHDQPHWAKEKKTTWVYRS